MIPWLRMLACIACKHSQGSKPATISFIMWVLTLKSGGLVPTMTAEPGCKSLKRWRTSLHQSGKSFSREPFAILIRPPFSPTVYACLHLRKIQPLSEARTQTVSSSRPCEENYDTNACVDPPKYPASNSRAPLLSFLSRNPKH